MSVDIPILKKLCEAYSIPGHEGEVAGILESSLRKSGLRVKRGKLGDVVGVREGTGQKFMLAAHMDEIGLLVRKIDDKGFLRFMKIGGIDDRTLLNQRVVVHTSKGRLYGVIGHKPPHIQEEREGKKVVTAKHMFIDLGAKDKKDAEKLGACIGDPVTFDIELRELANGLLCGKAIDNRVGCYVLLELASRIRSGNLLFVGSVQEEVSIRGKGATTVAFAEEPDCFIAVDTSVATDHPECGDYEGEVKLGSGPAIVLIEAQGTGNISDRRLVNWLVRVAEKHKIPYQLEASEGGATDASDVHSVRSGIPSISVSVPARYIHSNVGVVSKSDIENTIRLLEHALAEKPSL